MEEVEAEVAEVVAEEAEVVVVVVLPDVNSFHPNKFTLHTGHLLS